MALPAPRNKWRYGLTALACLPPAALTFEKALGLVDKGAVPIDKRNHNARTLADGWDITLWRRLPDSGPKAFAGVAVWRYDRPDQHDFRWRDDVLVLGFHVGIDDTPLQDPGAADSWVEFLLGLGDVLHPDFMAVDLYDDFYARRGRDLTREVFAVNVYGPATAAPLGPRLRAIPAIRVDSRPWGATVVRLAGIPFADSNPELRAEAAAALWPA